MKIIVNYKNESTITDFKNFDEKEYISNIYECEKQKYILENRLLRIQQKINAKKQLPTFEQTNFYNEYQSGCKCLRELPNEPREFSAEDYYGPLMLTFFAFAISGFVTPFILDTASFGTLFIVDIIISAIAFIIFINIKRSRFDKEYNTYIVEKNRITSANDEIENYNDKLFYKKKKEYEKYCSELLKYAEEYKKSVQPEYDEASKLLKNMRYVLLNLYDYRINGTLCLHPDYRGLIAISVIYGYFDTGRCTQLRGHEGAYNLYEE